MRSVSTAAIGSSRRSGGAAGGKGSSTSSSRRGAPRPSSPAPSPPKPGSGKRASVTSSPPKPKQGGAALKAKAPTPSSTTTAAATAAAPKKKKNPASSSPPTSTSPPPPPPPPETHKTFDEALITVRAGTGGRGEIVKHGSGTWVKNFKFKAGDGKSSRQIFLPSADPARGGDGGSVLLRADPSVPDLLHLRYEYNQSSNGSGKKADGESLKFTARDGRAGDASAGSNAPRAPGAAKRLEAAAAAAASANSSGFESFSRGPDAPPLVLRVPLGTVVKRAKGGGGGGNGNGNGAFSSSSSSSSLVGELLTPGQTLVVAQGGRGGTGVVAPRKGAAAAARARAAAAEAKRQRRLSGDGGASFDAFAAAAASSSENSNSSSDPNAAFLALEEEAEAFYEAGAEIEDDDSWKLDARGESGEGPLKLRLLLRVVADVGLVGLPNAGKSSMLAALTRARPEVAAYPFTTLRPNLGVLAAPLHVSKSGGGRSKKGEEGDEEGEEESESQQTTSFVFGGFEDEDEEEEPGEESEEFFERHQLDVDEEFAFGGRRRRAGGQGAEKSENDDPLRRGAAGAPGPVLADLPGLIEGAASGRGLGRAFLRHLRRARVILHVVDASTADPVSDYAAIRKELALYNPDYLLRPHVVALNKADLFFSSSDLSPSSSDDGGGETESEGAKPKIDLKASPPIPELVGQIERAAVSVFEEAVLRRRESDSESDDDGEEEDEERPATTRKAEAASTSSSSSSSSSTAASLPHSVVWTSADSDLGLEDLRGALSRALASTAGQPAPGGARSSQRAARKARKAQALLEFEEAEGRRGKDYRDEELEW